MEIDNKNINIANIKPLVTPKELRKLIPIDEKTKNKLSQTRRQIEAIIAGSDKRKLFVVGPCSIHNKEEALVYAQKLYELSKKVESKILLAMRCYFEKPRTTIGWKGLISDPDLNESYDMNKGYKIARQLCIDIAGMGLPIATEFLDPITPQYIPVSWAAIGARTTESQTHRQMASGLSVPVGFKNGTGGSIQLAIDAMQSAQSPHFFTGMNSDGQVSIIPTTGNQFGHLILRGGKNIKNHTAQYVQESIEQIKQHNMRPAIMIDCSHANADKRHTNQAKVFTQVLEQMQTNPYIIGLMLESNIHEGKISFTPGKDDPNTIPEGTSITDACIGWQETEEVILKAYKEL